MEKPLITQFVKKSFDKPDEILDLPGNKIQQVNLENFTISRIEVEPGWSWSETLPPIIGTETCQFEHPIWMVISGRFAVKMDDDGTTQEFGPGDIGMIPPGHDAWVVGDEPVTAIDIQVSDPGNK